MPVILPLGRARDATKPHLTGILGECRRRSGGLLCRPRPQGGEAPRLVFQQPAGPSCNWYHAARTRRVSAAGLAPTSGEIVTQIQSGGPRTDSLVRILHAQPRSRLKPEVRKRKTPSRGLRSASHSWPYACAGGPRPPVPPLLGGRSFTIGPFYAKPELLIGFAAAVACTIALRFMLQATYLTFCRPSLWRALGGQPRQVLSVGLAGILFWG